MKLRLLVFVMLASQIGKCFGQEILVDLSELRRVINEWNDAHNDKDLTAFESLYADEVIFYTKELPKSWCIGNKSKLLRSGLRFHQEVVSEPSVFVYSTGVVKVSFLKRVTSGSKTRDYDSYLLLRKFGNRLLIVGESDLITDGNLKFNLDLGKELKRSSLSGKGIDGEPAITTKPESQKILSPDLWSLMSIALIVAALVFAAGRLKKRTFLRNRKGAASGGLLPEEKGALFERYIVNRFDVVGQSGVSFFKLLDWRGDKFTNGIYPQSNMYPDMEYEFKMGTYVRRFAVECKFRTRLINQEFEIEERQLKNYVEFEATKGMPVYIVLGLGGSPSAPTDLFVIKLQDYVKSRPMSLGSLFWHWNDPQQKFFYNSRTDSLQTSFKK